MSDVIWLFSINVNTVFFIKGSNFKNIKYLITQFNKYRGVIKEKDCVMTKVLCTMFDVLNKLLGEWHHLNPCPSHQSQSLIHEWGKSGDEVSPSLYV